LVQYNEKEELNLYYPEIGEEQIFVTGTPQFECLQPEKIIAKEVFYKRVWVRRKKKSSVFQGMM
jgi:hypothetical protein